MQFARAPYARDIYHTELYQLVDYGNPVDVRGRKTLEILDYVTEVTEPWHHCILLPARRWNPWLAMSEALWIMSGRNDIIPIQPYNLAIGNYSDDGATLFGAYGERIFSQIEPMIDRLQKDPSDRRAILSIWETSDLKAVTKDPPCNNLLYFKLRDGRLHMTVICRSNDIHWGLYAVNLPTFGMLQVYLAARLGVGVGHQTHLSNSLHVYTDEQQAVAITERMLHTDTGSDRPIYPKHELVFTPDNFTRADTHYDFATKCDDVLEPEINFDDPSFPFLEFANDFLKMYREHIWEPRYPRHFSYYQDWIVAGQLFVDAVWKKGANVSA